MSTQQPGLELTSIPLDKGVLSRVSTEHRVADLEREVASLRTALQSRTTIAVATGLLAERYACSSTAAWALLTRVSSHANVKVREVARVLVALADGAGTPDDDAVLAAVAPHLPGLRPEG